MLKRVLLGFFWGNLILGGILPLGAMAEVPNPAVESRSKKALMETQSKLPEMESWQRTIFLEEAIPQYQRFIKPSAVSSPSIDAKPSEPKTPEIDEQGLKNYLAFYAPKTFVGKDPKMLVVLSGDACTKCKVSAPVIRVLTRARLLRRGFNLVWMDVGTQSVTEEKLSEWIKEKNAMGGLLVKWGPAPKGSSAQAVGLTPSVPAQDPDDPEAILPNTEVGERYAIQTYFKLGERTFQKGQEFGEAERFESFEARHLAEIFTELGAGGSAPSGAPGAGVERAVAGASIGAVAGASTGVQPAGQSPSASSAPVQERIVRVSGIKDFAHFLKVKTLLSTQLKDFVDIQERILSQGGASFAVMTRTNPEEFEKQLETLRANIAPEQQSNSDDSQFNMVVEKDESSH